MSVGRCVSMFDAKPLIQKMIIDMYNELKNHYFVMCSYSEDAIVYSLYDEDPSIKISKFIAIHYFTDGDVPDEAGETIPIFMVQSFAPNPACIECNTIQKVLDALTNIPK